MCCCSGAPKVGRGLRASPPRMMQAFKNLTIRAGPRPTRSAGQSRKRPCAVLGAALLAMLAGTPSFASGPVAIAVLNPTDDTFRSEEHTSELQSQSNLV